MSHKSIIRGNASAYKDLDIAWMSTPKVPKIGLKKMDRTSESIL